MPHSLYVGRLVKCLRRRDVRGIFEDYGRMLRCDVKYGTEMAYAFIDFERREDAEDCIKYENGREINGQFIIVEWATGRKGVNKWPVRRTSALESDVCFRCRGLGHWARDCTVAEKFRKKGDGGESGRERSRSPIRRSPSRYGSKSKGHSRSPNQKLENHPEPEAHGKSPHDSRCHDDDDDDPHKNYDDHGDRHLVVKQDCFRHIWHKHRDEPDPSADPEARP